jgi:hypothetical protein
VTAAEIGVRAGVYKVECLGDTAEARYRDDFGFVREIDWEDAEFLGQIARGMTAEREVFDAKLNAYAAARPGAVLLPATTLEFRGDRIAELGSDCVRSLMTGVQPEFFRVYDVQAVHFGLKGQKPRPMP